MLLKGLYVQKTCFGGGLITRSSYRSKLEPKITRNDVDLYSKRKTQTKTVFQITNPWKSWNLSSNRNTNTHHVKEEQGLIKVGVLLCVLDDCGMNNMSTALKLNTGWGDTGQLIPLHVPNAPAQDLQNITVFYTGNKPLSMKCYTKSVLTSCEHGMSQTLELRIQRLSSR